MGETCPRGTSENREMKKFFLLLFLSINIFAAQEQLKIPEISIFGEDLSRYGLQEFDLKFLPAKDKEKYIPEKFVKKDYTKSVFPQSIKRLFLAGGNEGFSSGNFLLADMNKKDKKIFFFEENTFQPEEEKKDTSFAVGTTYERKGKIFWKLAPKLQVKKYEIPDLSGISSLRKIQVPLDFIFTKGTFGFF